MQATRMEKLSRGRIDEAAAPSSQEAEGKTESGGTEPPPVDTTFSHVEPERPTEPSDENSSDGSEPSGSEPEGSSPSSASSTTNRLFNRLLGVLAGRRPQSQDPEATAKTNELRESMLIAKFPWERRETGRNGGM